nr:hypothetical protein [Tanacetum cinerariifolium]
LGLQVNQFSNGIFKNQSKYILDILKRFVMKNCDTIPTPMVEQAKLKLDLVGKPVDHTDYRIMIGSLMYVTSSRPDIVFATCLWYPKDSCFDLTAYSDADHAGCHLDRKIESEYVAVSICCAQVLWMRTQLTDYDFFYDKVPIYCDSKSAIAISCNPGEGSANPTKPHHIPSPQEHQSPQSAYSPHHDSLRQTVIPEPIPHDLQAPTKTLTPKRLTKRAIRITQSKALSPDADEPASLSRDNRHGEAFPTVLSLDAGQDRENIAKTSAMPHESSPRVPSLDADEGRVKLGADKSTDTEEMVNVGAAVSTASVSPADVFPTVGVPTISAIFTTASVVTPYTRRSRGLDRSNEVIAKHLSEFEQVEADLSVRKKIELIRMTLEQIKEKFIPVWKKFEDFVPMYLKEESERLKRPGLKLDQGSSKRVKISHTSRSEPSQEQQFKGSEGVSEEEIKGMMQLVPLEEVYIEALHHFDREDLHQLWIFVKETFSIKQSTRDKEKDLWVELKRLFKPYFKDQLWTYDQAFMHDPLDWKLYDTCGVHHVSTKNQEIFMLVEKDYPLRK